MSDKPLLAALFTFSAVFSFAPSPSHGEAALPVKAPPAKTKPAIIKMQDRIEPDVETPYGEGPFVRNAGGSGINLRVKPRLS